jgi:PAS domain S-box-containing protein
VKQDVTEFREVYERLQARDDLFRRLLENALDIITILDVDDESPAFRRILGYEPHELEGRRAFEFMPAEDVEKALAPLGRLRGVSGAAATLEFRFRHNDGSWRILEAIGKNMLDDPTLAGVLINSRDVTERRRIENELASQRAVRVQSDKLADMGTLLAGVAHELNNPLTVVTGYSSILRQSQGDGPSRERLDKITAAAERCVRIVRNFLALARQPPPERQVGGAAVDRVVVIAGRTKSVVWQYRVTDQKGHAPGHLNSPDGFDVDVFRHGLMTPVIPASCMAAHPVVVGGRFRRRCPSGADAPQVAPPRRRESS